MKHFALTAFALLALTACGPNNNNNQQQQQAWNNGNDSVQVCMDRNSGQRLPDNQCQQQANYNSGISPFVWFYLGSQMAVPAYYQPIPRYYGTFAPVAGYHYYHDSHPGGMTVIQRRTYIYPRNSSAPIGRPVIIAPRPAPATGTRLSQGSSAGTSPYHPVTVAPVYRAPVAAPVSAYRPSVSSGSSYRSSFGGGSSSFSSSRSYSSSSSSRRH